MSPTPQEVCSSTNQDALSTQQLDGNKVVISGMSGLYPQSRNVKEFSEILYNKVNPVTQEALRYKYNHPEVTQYTGSVTDLNLFDAQFFKVHFRLAFVMDPMAKKLLEQTYQAIYDAGINPDQLSGNKVGVYIGSCFSETEKACFYEASARSGFGVAGCSKTMFANRISYWLNAKGPSMAIDEACCSSTAALEQAYMAVKRGDCEAAIVGGSYLCLHPQSSVHYNRLIKLCNDGKTKCFDEHADGCAKSEAINVLFLQKAKDAVRVYAEVMKVKTEFTCLLNDETGPKYGFYRKLSSMTNFIKKFYEDTNVPPHAIEYVEAFGSALPEADKVELTAIEKVFCEDREDPLLIGSVMSNIGYGEASSGISAITKVLLGYHNGRLAANLHCEHPRQDIAALREGRMRIVTDHQSFRRTYVAVNGMSVTGTNSHVLLHGHYKPKDPNRYKASIPYLVTISGRHEASVKHSLETLKSSPIDPEQLALLHNIHRTSISGHMGRGFIILQTNDEQKTISLSEKAEYFDDARRPLWFVYSGMGSQWTGMGVQLMRIPVFAAAIERCGKALEPKGLDIIGIITSPNEKFCNILHSFVGIAAIQIGLTDILRRLGLNPDGIIGHSVGELGCAYADGCLTAEEMILSAYYRGLVSLETEFIHGSMAAVGMGYEQISQLCPPEIQVACHNGPDSSTLSGPSDAMREFVADLTAKGIYAKEVPCSNIAYHSRYIANAGPGLLKYLKEAITSPKTRSDRWISSSVPESRWNEPIAKLCSAEYLSNNLLSPVLFEETSRLIPNNAVLVEIAPHGLLQAILKRSMPSSCVNIALARRSHPDNAFLLLEAIGKLYMEGYYPNVQVLYPTVEMPVSTGTPFLSDLIKWAHEEKWPMPMYQSAARKTAANCDFVVALQDKESAYLAGYSIRGNTLYPFAASLILVWDTLAMILGMPRKQMSVEFNYVQLYAQPKLHSRRQLKLSVAILRGTGRFEILDGVSKVITGFVKTLKTTSSRHDIMYKKNEEIYFNAEDIYQLLRDRDFQYSDRFQSLKNINESLDEAMLLWEDNWVTFIDGMIQMNALRQPDNVLSLPTRIRSICINVDEQMKHIINSNTADDTILMVANVNEQLDKTICGGVVMENIQFKEWPTLGESKLALKSSVFVSNHQSNLDVASSLAVCFQIVAENITKSNITVSVVTNQIKGRNISKEISNATKYLVGIKVICKEITREMALKDYDFNDVDLILIRNLSTDEQILQTLQNVLQSDQFVASEEDLQQKKPSKLPSMYRVICSYSIDNNNTYSELHLIRWGPSVVSIPTTTISVGSSINYNYLSSVHATLEPDHCLLIVASYPAPPRLEKLIRKWRRQTIRNKIYLITVMKEIVGRFETRLPKTELAFNIVNDSIWGGEFYLPLKEKVTTERKNIKLQSECFGDYDTIHWVEASTMVGTGIAVKVHYVGLNHNDIKKRKDSSCTVKNIENSHGLDFSGLTENGDRVMGIVSCGGAARSQVRAQPELMWPVPEHWSLEDAATVPLAYMQAFYCLVIKSKLYPKMTILIHGGAGALGQAIISIALAFDCEVFTTVSDAHKKQFLLKLFPALKAENIGNSRDSSFGNMVLLATKKKGCDIIISCVKENLRDVSIKCISYLGTCLDVSQIQDQDNYTFGMFNLHSLKNYCIVDFSSMFASENKNQLKILHEKVSAGIAAGYVRPLSRLTYAPHDVVRGFRLLATSQHRGRVLINMNDNILQAQHRLQCSADSCHFLFCAGAAFGLKFADRLVARGVKKLCLHVPKETTYLQHKIRSWQKLGVQVIVYSTKLKEKDVSAIISEATNLGSLEGVYVAVGNDEENVNEMFIMQLDLVLRRLCLKLRYFAVFNVGDQSVGKKVCLDRISNQLSAVVLSFPDLTDSGFTDCVGWQSAFNAAEQALQSSNGILLAHREQKSSLSLLQEITKIGDIRISNDTDKNLTLQELGVQDHKLQQICDFLQTQHNIALDDGNASLLTINTILELERAVTELPYEDVKGLQTFFNYIDSDELLATAKTVFLPTRITCGSLRDDEFKFNEINLYIIPGVEGHHERFRVLCERVKIPAIVLQPGLDHPYETFEDMAQRFAEVLLEKTGLKDKFYLLGYESGILTALAIAAHLEEHGLTGTVFCLGCTPTELKKELECQLANYKTEEQLQDEVLRHMYKIMAGDDTSGLEKALLNNDSWSQKVDKTVRILLGRVPHSAQYASALIKYALARIQQARHDTIAVRPLRSQLVLLHAVHNPPEYESLQQHSHQPLVVHQLSTSLAHVTKDLQCAAIINEHLDSTILEAFETRNMCDTYLLNANLFMARES